jgi:hypothetical protein
MDVDDMPMRRSTIVRVTTLIRTAMENPVDGREQTRATTSITTVVSATVRTRVVVLVVPALIGVGILI